ncbi:MAG: glutamate-5-semialdehyde dehydrogenase [Kiritimatiellia bacterium]
MTENTETVVQLSAAKSAARRMRGASDAQRVHGLQVLATILRESTKGLLEANAKDLAELPPADVRRDRLALTPERIEAMARTTEAVAMLPDPLGAVLEERSMASGIHLRRVCVPLGVVGCIYEARPNVTVDLATLCLRTGNVVLLKGGKEAKASNEALMRCIAAALTVAELPATAVTLMGATHADAEALMSARGFVDVLIPRGSAALIQSVREKATVPVIETGAGVCHLYVHEDADLAMAARIIENAKTRRVSVCNALDCVLIHQSLQSHLSELLAPCRAKGVTVHEQVYGREWLSMDLSVRMVASLDEALDHIARYGSGHSEAIVTRDRAVMARFQNEVDAACVYVNTPTSFTDGGEFGLGAEVGISTQKLHARGPMGLSALTTSKWLIDSEGAVRP